jgi:alkanesulfonate monooxygenase SsuD/methylene tetrahydromethanopterin reductase-like flavin-dependent oxidoreductase (luciferase family)
MLNQCDWTDRLGVDYVWLSEHRASPNGYMPSPLIAAEAIATRTSRMQIFVSALLLPLHDPIGVVEDIAVVDLLSRGRLQVVLAGGYVPAEFAMFTDRGIVRRC